MPNKRKRSRTGDFGIAEVSGETGISKESLRTWERRYGFPAPVRNKTGDRLYPPDQVEKLSLISRLIANGRRPHDIINATKSELSALVAQEPAGTVAKGGLRPEIGDVLQALKNREPVTVRRLLQHAFAELGSRRLVLELIAPLNRAVGDAWANGAISTADEHLYSEQAELILRSLIGSMNAESGSFTVLLTTLPGEQHRLGLLMLEVLLTLERAHCVALGTALPASEIVRAANDHRADIVGLSFSSAFARSAARKGLAELRGALPQRIALWAGGDGVSALHDRLDGVLMPMDLDAAVAEMRRLRGE